jgi:hypothetical protein
VKDSFGFTRLVCWVLEEKPKETTGALVKFL